MRKVRPNAGRAETKLHLGIEEVLQVLWRQPSSGRVQRQRGVSLLWPDFSSFSFAPQFPRRSGQVRSGDNSVQCSGNSNGSEAFTTLGDHINVSGRDASKSRQPDTNGQCICSGRWG